MRYIFSHIIILLLLTIQIQAKNLEVIPPESEDDNYLGFVLSGNNENCEFSLGEGSIWKGDCIKTSNSKKQIIICTPKKTICKTENEIYDVVNTYERKELNIFMDYSANDSSKIFHEKLQVPCSTLGTGMPSLANCYSFPMIDFGNGKAEVIGLFSDTDSLISITLISEVNNLKNFYESSVKKLFKNWKLISVANDTGDIIDMVKEKNKIEKVTNNTINSLINSNKKITYINLGFAKLDYKDYKLTHNMKDIYTIASTNNVADVFLIKSNINNKVVYAFKSTFYFNPLSFNMMNRLQRLKKEKKIKLPKKEIILDITDVFLDYKKIKGTNICVNGTIVSYDGVVWLKDLTDNSLHLDTSSMSREIRKTILTDCRISSDECKNLTICGQIKDISFSKGLIVNEIK